MVLRVPNTQGRYYIMQLIDAYSRSVEDIGVGTLGARAASAIFSLIHKAIC